jgi:septal ring factor EnvC (AmiA/AmiB activator)
MDNPLKSLAVAEASIASKDAQLIEIEIELDRKKTSIENLNDAKKHKAKSVRQTTNLKLQLAQASLFVRDVKADKSSFKSEGL